MPLQVNFKFGNLTRTDGSALLASGDIAIQAAVIGPGEISQHKECPDSAVIDVSLKRLAKASECEYLFSCDTSTFNLNQINNSIFCVYFFF